MASLTANVNFATNGLARKGAAIPMRCHEADTFYRGGLLFWTSGRVRALVDADGTEFAGVVAEYGITTAQDQFVLVYPCTRGGLFLYANANFTIANQGALFYQTLAGEDDPSTLTTTQAGNSGAVGRLVQVKTSGTDGWIDIGDRFAPANA